MAEPTTITPLTHLRDLLVARPRITDAAVVNFDRPNRQNKHVVRAPKLIFISRGALDYTIDGHTIRMEAGAMLYRPAFSTASWNFTNASTGRLCYCEFIFDARSVLTQPVWVRRTHAKLEFAAFERLSELFREPDEGALLEAEGELKAMLGRFLHRAAGVASMQIERPHNRRGATGELAVRRAMTYLAQNIARRDVLGDLHQQVGMSEDHFRRIFHKRAGMSPQRYLISLRMEAARSALERTDLSVKEVAATVGYDDPLYFSRHYRRFFRRPPSADRVFGL